MRLQHITFWIIWIWISFPNALAAIDLNLATEEELQQIDGLGPVKAKAIIAFRKSHGQFKSIEELDQVNGIGPKTIIKLKKELSVRPNPSAQPAILEPSGKNAPLKTERLSTTHGVIDAFTQTAP